MTPGFHETLFHSRLFRGGVVEPPPGELLMRRAASSPREEVGFTATEEIFAGDFVVLDFSACTATPIVISPKHGPLGSLPGPKEQHHGAPLCRCGSRATRRVGYLLRECSKCGRTFAYRLDDGVLVPMTTITAELTDYKRRHPVAPGRTEGGNETPPSAWSYPDSPRLIR